MFLSHVFCTQITSNFVHDILQSGVVHGQLSNFVQKCNNTRTLKTPNL